MTEWDIKGMFTIGIFGNPLSPAESVKKWTCGLTLHLPCVKMFRVSEKVVLRTSKPDILKQVDSPGKLDTYLNEPNFQSDLST